ncbi:hypothetical protein KUTeg_003708 [Tegillarca granosa]|uniref:glutamyl aminopeptidase n=1 Tax=Tegillarca granosa TaxID=220873 RepID=A0ABQ9FPQ9_TEGGR|nr:hypothetical protein KUTeg_003708 [Tegillarca granosa]
MKTYNINKRIVYVVVFLFVAIPVAVGLLTWYFTSSECEMNNNAAIADQGSQPPTTTSIPEVSEPWKNLRLPVNVEAIHYDITLYPDFYDDRGWFYGNESVELLIKEETSHILIHFNFLNITRVVLRNNMTNEIIVPNRTFTNLAASKFQPVAARRAFPCLDEPNFKAEYTIRLVHKPEYRALSNMPINSEEVWMSDNTLRKTSFKRSVKMSTYLVAFIVCDFDYLDTTTSYGKPVRTFSTPDKVNQTEYSLQIANDTMKLYQDLFNVEYPLPKQDMVAIPDYVSGATEHWGLIGYRETNMLYNKDQASPANKQRVAVFVTEDVQTVMINDAGIYSHPIIVAVESPDQINEVFDVISYSKNFLTKFKWSNAKTDDLWTSIGKVSDELTVKDVMDTWTIQMGFPYIDITYRWHVYLDYFTSDSAQGHTWINRKDQVTFDIPVNPLVTSDAWVKFNIGQTGFYRVNYPGFLWNRFATLLQQNPKVLADVDKTGLISDAFNLARGGYLPYQYALNLTLYLNKEHNHLPWESAYQAFSYISNMLMSGVGSIFFKKLNHLMRVNLISLVCGLGDSECLQNASTRFNDWVYEGVSVTPNLRSQVYKYGMKKSTVTEWDFMWNKYKVESVPQERINLLYGMSQTQEIWLLKRNPVGSSVVWDWTRENWTYLVDSNIKLTQVRDFFQQYPDAGAGARGRLQALESIQSNINWMNSYQNSIVDWLNQQI